MPEEMTSLLAGRNKAPLSKTEIVRATNVFLGLDSKISARYEADSRTAFRISAEESGAEFGEIVFGPDIYPGTGVVDPNSALSLDAAVAHELTHYHRWRDKIAIEGTHLMHVDEALTNLQAVCRYERQLSSTDIRLLVGDAMQRLQLYVQELAAAANAEGK